MIKKVCVVSPVYPRPRFPESGRFTANLTESWSKSGVSSDVVRSVTWGDLTLSALRKPVDVSTQNVTVTEVYVPGTPFKNRLPNFLFARLERLGRSFFTKAVIEKVSDHELIYAQFAGSGHVARAASRSTGIPYFVDLGESYSLIAGSEAFVEGNRQVLCDAAGIVCVSPRLEDEAIVLGCDPDRVLLLPNTPDRSRFRVLNKVDCRSRLGLDLDRFLAVYVGHFIDRKGAPRVNAARKEMKRSIDIAFLGSGIFEPDCPDIVKCGSVTHDDLPLWLNAADVMVLPTLAEGCCNAIVEALACGLPMITSDIEDVRWQVPEQGIILVDPKDIGAIAASLDELVGNPDRLAAMRVSLISDQTMTQNRSSAVLEFLQTQLDSKPRLGNL